MSNETMRADFERYPENTPRDEDSGDIFVVQVGSTSPGEPDEYMFAVWEGGSFMDPEDDGYSLMGPVKRVKAWRKWQAARAQSEDRAVPSNVIGIVTGVNEKLGTFMAQYPNTPPKPGTRLYDKPLSRAQSAEPVAEMRDDFQDRPFAQRGQNIERLGRLMQQPETTIEELIHAGLEAGLHIGFGLMVEGRPVRDPEDDESENSG